MSAYNVDSWVLVPLIWIPKFLGNDNPSCKLDIQTWLSGNRAGVSPTYISKKNISHVLSTTLTIFINQPPHWSLYQKFHFKSCIQRPFSKLTYYFSISCSSASCIRLWYLMVFIEATSYSCYLHSSSLATVKVCIYS